jgi:hypothetical protein
VNSDLQRPGLLEAEIPIIANDDVIKNDDAEDVATGDEAPRDFEIVNRWRWVAGRMVVADDDSRRVREQGCLETLRAVMFWPQLCGAAACKASGKPA